MDLLRIATAGSVDDGKSTLLGRLLYETKSIPEDQLTAVESTSKRRGDEYTDLALLTDGLRAEREQGITIDVAYRYFQTPKRKFILADTPGHVQYTRNMVTGASRADLALILVDARKGLVEQSRRHITLASMLRVPHVVVCVNKMDLVGYDQARYEEIRAETAAFVTRLEIHDLAFLPVSALSGDNVVQRSAAMTWFEGAPLLHHLENLYVASDRNLIDNRFPVQMVIRPRSLAGHDYRGYAGRVEGGVWKPGDEVVALPSGFTSTVASIDTADGPVEEAFPPMAVTVRLTDDIDVSRGDMLCRPNNRPTIDQDIEAMVCWMSPTELRAGASLHLKHTTRWVRAKVEEIRYVLDITTLHRRTGVDQLELNDIARIRLRTSKPLFHDEYRRNRQTGSFILVDEATNTTAAAGMIFGAGT